MNRTLRLAVQGLERWEDSQAPFTNYFASDDIYSSSISSGLSDFLNDLRSKKRGLIVVGEQLHASEAQACLQIAAELGWPLCADALSGRYISSLKSQGILLFAISAYHMHFLCCGIIISASINTGAARSELSRLEKTIANLGTVDRM